MTIAAFIRSRRLNAERAFVIIAMMVVYQAAIGWSMKTLLTPPAGNSVGIKASTINGVQIYMCSRGEWRFVGARAILVDSNNSSLSIGSYSYAFMPTDVSAIGTWSLNNSDGVIAESGHAVSTVTGRVILFSGNRFALPEFLAQASSHRFEGTASLVSYIQQIPNDGCFSPNNLFCKKGSPPFHVPFEADYWFWTQDRQPPSLPATLIASGRMIEAFFSTGYIEYHFNGNAWQQKSSNASMYDVPGGTLVGRFFINSKADAAGGTFTWEVFDPNGWTVIAKQASSDVRVDRSSLPWRLFNVTSGINNKSSFGTITQVQMVSTRGGLPPAQQKAPVAGRVSRSFFSAISWFYTSS